jgi:uncharacterized membrane protein YoaK (UPF0700 family)
VTGKLVVLAGAAGMMDAVAYLGLGVFTTMMTGNTVLLAFAVARGQLAQILPAGLALAAFATGAAAGALITGADRPDGTWPRVVTRALAWESVVLAVFAAAWQVAGASRGTPTTALLILLSSLAMGMQAAAVRHLGVPGVATTYITSTLTALSAEIVGWARAGDTSGARRLRLLAAVVVAYGLGAVVGAMSMFRWTAAVWLPLICVATVATSASLRHRQAISAAPARPVDRPRSALGRSTTKSST